MTAGRKVIFINRVFSPEEQATAQLLHDLVHSLSKRGHHVSVICRQHNQRNETDSTESSPSVIRLDCRGAGGRLTETLRFFHAARRQLQASANAGDVVVIMTDPPMLSVALTGLAKSLGCKVVHWIQDIYPEVIPATTAFPAPPLLRWLRDRSWRAADLCVTLGDDMARFIESRGVAQNAVKISANWTPQNCANADTQDVESLKSEWGLTGKFIVGYSGNLGRVHDIETIIKSAARLAHDDAIKFVIVGQGARLKEAQHLVADLNLKNVRFIAHQPRERLSASLQVPDVHLTTLRAGCETLVFPSKLYGIASAGKPILFVGPITSGIALLIQAQAMGVCIANGDADELARQIQHIAKDPSRKADMAAHALSYAQSQAHIDRAGEEWDSLIRSL